MPTRPSSPDPSSPDGKPSPFPGFGAGLDFFQDWFKAASSALPHMSGQSTPGTPAWTLPTIDPAELDKRIQELKTVQFWLEQNARMIGMSIQALEVQRMTLDTLKGMKVPMDALRESLKARAQAPEEPAAATNTSTPAAQPDSASAPPTGVNPMQWWSTLTEQFTNLAQQAVQAGQDVAASSAAPSTASAASPAQKASAPRKAKTPPRQPTSKPSTAGKTPARKASSSAGTIGKK